MKSHRVSVTVLVFTCIFALGVGLVASAADVRSQETLYRQFPPTIFAPNGRLYNVEESSKKASDSDDTSSNSIIAVKCQDGIIIVSSPTRSPHFYYNKKNDDKEENGDDTEEELIIPLGIQEYQALSLLSTASPNVILGAAGNAMDSSVLLDRMERMALDLSSDESAIFGSSSNLINVNRLARSIADRIQWSTQSVRNGRILASCALLVSRYGEKQIWRIDPTGQFYHCHVAILGRGAGIMEDWFQKHILQDKQDISSLEPTDVQSYVESKSKEEVLSLACQCIQQCLTGNDDDDELSSLCAIFVPKQPNQPLQLLSPTTISNLLQQSQ